MNDEDIIKSVVELLKGINNSAAEMVRSGNFENAVKMYEMGEQTSLKFYYTDGAVFNRLYIAKIHIIEEQYDAAMDCLDKLAEYEMSQDAEKALTAFYKEAGMVLLKAGMNMEAAGNLTGALQLFEKIQPYLNKKRADAVEKEIILLRSKVSRSEMSKVEMLRATVGNNADSARKFE